MCEDPNKTKVFRRKKVVRGRLQSEFRFLVNGGLEPKFCIEPSCNPECIFITHSKGNKLIGRLTNSGALVKGTNKEHYLSKLNLVPSKAPESTDSEFNDTISTESDDMQRSSSSSSSGT